MQALKKNGLLESNRVYFLKISSIYPNPGQPRRIFDTEGLRELSESIKQYGVLQPLSVRKRLGGGYELIAGERRLRASRIAGLNEVPCIVIGADEKQSSLIALVENLQRCDLDFFEEAEGLQRLIYQFGLSQDETARRIGKSQSAVANKLRLLRHPPEMIECIRENGLTERHARALLRLESLEDRQIVLDTIVAKHLNVSQTDEYIDGYLSHGNAPSDQQNPREHIRTLYVFKDLRLFLNTVNRAIETMRRSGVSAEMDRVDGPDGLVLTIKIPKKAG